MGSKKTAWHPPFIGHLQEHSPRWTRVRGEVQLTAEPLRVDGALEIWARLHYDPTDPGSTLRGLWKFIVLVCLLEYKSKVAALPVLGAVSTMQDAALRTSRADGRCHTSRARDAPRVVLIVPIRYFESQDSLASLERPVVRRSVWEMLTSHCGI